LSGNHVKALEYHYKALAVAEKIGNESILAMVCNQLAHIYKDRSENRKAIGLYRRSMEHSVKGRNEFIRIWPLSNLGTVYYNNEQLDSALILLQRAFELNMSTGHKLTLSNTLLYLGEVHMKLNNKELALSYYKMAEMEGTAIRNPRVLNMVYTSIAAHFERNRITDSAIFYANKAVSVVSNSGFYHLSSAPAQLLSGLYEKTNCDSTVKYIRLYKTANDALYNARADQQVQLMTLEEDHRQKELAAERAMASEERSQSIQYAMIALGIVILMIVFLLLSHSIIVTGKFISFFTILGLLIVFEFINLLIHPFLGRVTHHSPVLMLLAMVAVASMLIPFHHRVEKWVKTKMTARNKKIRLEKAKKTLIELEGADGKQ
jgi:tetratricopeptide (TPR) repeat protein